jgi:hypothetical protein
MTSGVTLEYAARTPYGTGDFVAFYLRVLAWVSIAWMAVEPVFFDSFHFNVGFIFLFCAASALKRRSRTARKWVVGIAGVMLAAGIASAAWAVAFGTAGMSVSMGGRRIKDPALWQLLAVVLPMLAIAGVPFVALLSPRARREFADKPVHRDAPAHPSDFEIVP